MSNNVDVDELVSMFDDLIKGGLLSHNDLITEGHTEVVSTMFLKPEPNTRPEQPCKYSRGRTQRYGSPEREEEELKEDGDAVEEGEEVQDVSFEEASPESHQQRPVRKHYYVKRGDVGHNGTVPMKVD
eukprot:PhF_6_TR23985/c0_g1_i1/m.33589